MASRKFTDEERRNLAFSIATYIINENKLNHKVSTRSLSSIFKISNYTVSILMGDYLKKCYPELYMKVKSILNKNIPKTINDIDIKQRVLEAAKLVLLGKKIAEIANELNVSEYVIQEDLQTRLKKIDADLYEKVLFIHNQSRQNNLNNGNNSYINQNRDELGRFGCKK